MKFLITATALTLSLTTFATDITFEELAGNYTISSNIQPGVKNIVNIDATGSLTFIERSMGMDYRCTGTAEITWPSIVSSYLTCEDGMKFFQEITLTDIDVSTNEFSANVFSSLFEDLGIKGPVKHKFVRN
jgi:hypothetical protein